MGTRSIAKVITWKLRPAEKAVLLVLAYHCNDNTNRCDPSVLTIAAEACMGVRTVKRYLPILEMAGAITRERRNGMRNGYILHESGQSGTSANLAPVPTEVGTSAKSGMNQGHLLAPEQKNRKNKKESETRCVSDSDGVGPVFLLKDGQEWKLTPSAHERLTADNPNVDTSAELAKAALWCETHPGRRKTAKGMKRFIDGWFSRTTSNCAPKGISDADFWNGVDALEQNPQAEKVAGQTVNTSP